MAQTLSLNLVHLVFSTKNRKPLISEEIGSGLHAYLASTSRRLDCDCFRVGGVQDHVHPALRLAATRTSARVVSEIKTFSSVWMKEQGVGGFAWQSGYGLFSVEPADLGALMQYIDAQRKRHAKRSFQDEMRGFCEKYHVAIDERYAWDYACVGPWIDVSGLQPSGSFALIPRPSA
jgi:REP element-mobilizing transposase RayT